MSNTTRRSPFFRDSRKIKPWSFKEMVERMSGKSFDEVKQRELEKRKGVTKS